MRRREFIAGVGALAAGLPLMASAQPSAMPVVGFVNPTSSSAYPHVIAAFRQGLQELGFVDGRNVAIEYRWAEGRVDALPKLIAELVHRQVAVIAATGGGAAALAAKQATSSIPIVFNSADDPVRSGLVDSLNRPGSNLTGVGRITTELTSKRVELLAEVARNVETFAFLVNPENRAIEARTRDVAQALQSLGRKLHVMRADSAAAIDATFASLGHTDAKAMLILNDSLFNARSEQLGALSARHRIPAIYQNREFVVAGGLMSYGPSLAEAYRVVGQYAGRILKGEKPAALPVQLQSKVDFFVNLKTAKALGLAIPLPLLGLADEAIE